MTWITKIALLGACALLPACDGQACTEIAAASVTLEVVDAQTDEPITDADIAFTVDGGEPRAPADAFDGTYGLAYEEEGTFEVTIAAPGYEPAQRTYDIELDAEGCHVDGVTDTVELNPPS